MPSPLIVVTGFGPFPGTVRNPSREVALALERRPPAGTRVLARELPVTFAGAPAAIDALVDGLPERPVLLLGLGVQPEPTFRLERRARGRLCGARVDGDGRTADEVGVDAGGDLECGLELEPLAEALRGAGARDVLVSSDAGGYVCERTYHRLLAAGVELGVPALFLHVPPVAAMDPAEQERIVRAMLERYSSAMRGRSSGEAGAEAAKARNERTKPGTSRPM